MESRANYTVVGIFAVVFLFAFALSVLWFGKFGIKDEYDLYRVFATESVSGLNIEAPVKYRGVVVGKVYEIKINEQNSELIELILKIKKGTPIRTSSIAALKPQGVTGLSFVDIKPGDGKSPLLVADGSKMPTIKYSESIFSKLDSSFSSMSDKMASILFKVDSALSDKNMEELSRTIQNLQKVTAQLAVLTEESAGLPTETKEVLKKLSVTVDSANGTISKMDHAIKRGDFDYKKDVLKVTNEAERLLVDMRALVSESNNLVKDLQKNPSSIIFEQKQMQRGPGE